MSALDKALKRLLRRIVFHDAESRHQKTEHIFQTQPLCNYALSAVHSPYAFSFYSFSSCAADRKSFEKKNQAEAKDD